MDSGGVSAVIAPATARAASLAGDPFPSSPDPADRTRFEQLINGQLDDLFRSALRLTRNQAMAEDLVQDVVLKAWRSFRAFREMSRFGAWVHRILMNTFFDLRRRQVREPQPLEPGQIDTLALGGKVFDGESGEAGSPEFRLERLMDSEVREGLDDLPFQYRSAVLLADVHGYSHREIADILNIPRGTVMSRLFRGRHLLRIRLQEFAANRHLLSRASS